MNNKNIQLKPITKDDLKYFLKWWKDDDLIKLTSGIREDSDEVLSGYFNAMIESKNDYHFLIECGNAVIGHISLTMMDKKTFEIHIIIGEKEYLGIGLGVLAIKEALDIAFNRLGYNGAYLEVRPDNIRAIKAYKKCGFKEDGIKKYPDNKNQPEVLKMILKKEIGNN